MENIEYHRGWVQERNPEPDKLHNKFAWAEKHGVSISIGPGDIGESMSNKDGRLLEMELGGREIDDDIIEVNTLYDAAQIFKNELFHNSDHYSKPMKKAMSLCITRMHESKKVECSGLTYLTEFLERFIKSISVLNESEITDKVRLAVSQEASEARKAARRSIELGVTSGMPRMEFDKVEKHLANVLRLYIKALSQAKSSDPQISQDYASIIKDIKAAIDAAFDEIRTYVEDTNKSNQLKIYHSFGNELIVQPEELNAEYYAKYFLDKIAA